jgi:hypothetical protein
MAKLLEDKEVLAGVAIRVENQNRKPMEDEEYYAIWLEDSDGDNERCVLLTDNEVERLPKFESCELAKVMVRGRLYRAGCHAASSQSKNSSFVKIELNGENIVVRVSPVLLKRAEARAKRNYGDLTRKSFITNLLD